MFREILRHTIVLISYSASGKAKVFVNLISKIIVSLKILVNFYAPVNFGKAVN